MARFFLWRRLPLTLKMVLATVAVGSITWVGSDFFLSEKIQDTANQQLLLYLDREAASNRLRFDRFLRTQKLAAEFIISSKSFHDYIGRLPARPPSCAPVTVTMNPPPWLPPNSLLRTIAPIDNIMMVSEDGSILECFQLSGPLPEDIIDGSFLPLLSHSSSVLIKRQEGIFLILKKSFTSPGRRPLHLILLSRINNAFLRAFHNIPGDKTQVAIIDPNSARVLVSSDPLAIPAHTPIDRLQPRFLTTGTSFLDYGIATEPLSLFTLLPQQDFAREVTTIVAHERVEHALAAAMLIATFSLLVYWITRRITALTAEVLQFEASQIGAEKHGRLKGDELAVLADRFRKLTHEILLKQEKLEQETTARITLLRKNLELEKRQEQFALLQQVTQALNVGILRLDNGRPIPCNPLMEELSWETNDSAIFSVDIGGDKKLSIELPDKGIRIFRVTRPEALADLDVILVRDITDEERMGQTLQKQKNLEAIGIMAGGIAHDFNNILTAILGNISLARLDLTEFDDHDSPISSLKKAEASCLSAREITSRFLTFSRGGSPIKYPCDIRELLQNSVHSGLVGMSTKVEFDLGSNLPPLHVDSNQMSHVFANIAKNAAEAMDGKGMLTVNATMETLKKKNTLLLPAGCFMKFSFQDNGPGMSPEIINRIFDPYFTTKPMGVTKAVGMGLAVAHSVVTSHGGSMTASSSTSGTTIFVYLPIDTPSNSL